MHRMKEQALRYDTRVVSELVVEADLSVRPFRFTTSSGTTVRAHTVVVAPGAKAKWIGLENELRLAQIGGGVSACAVCDGALPHFRNKVLAVVGGGDTAMEEALYLTKYASEVLVIHRRDSFRASKAMATRVLEHPKVRVLWNSQVADVLGEHEITGLRLRSTTSGVESEIAVGGLFVAIGHEPNTKFLGGQVETTPHGYIVTTPGRTSTSVDGVFAAGDVIDDYYRQAITSAGTGCMAALEAERWLAHHGIGESPVLETSETAAAIESALA
jgi:thioredoxin reductase (NADPH)